MKTFESSGTRRRFLRQIGAGLAAGIGVLAFPSAAKAEFWVCCPAVGNQCPTQPACNPGDVRYFCQCSQFGGADYCTGCQPDVTCYNGPC
jgi:hypothetical protein